jgi:hypothetical protein
LTDNLLKAVVVRRLEVDAAIHAAFAIRTASAE